MEALTEDVVEASKASTGNISLEMADLNFVELVQQVIGEFAERFQERNLSIMVHFDQEDESSAQTEEAVESSGKCFWKRIKICHGKYQSLCRD